MASFKQEAATLFR